MIFNILQLMVEKTDKERISKQVKGKERKDRKIKK